jgi:sigma-B regulation protein RsbU (phosphoserine phosphatase)
MGSVPFRAEQCFGARPHYVELAERPNAPMPKIVELEQRAQEAERENLSLRQMLLEAADLQRKLAGFRTLVRGDYEIASETFAANYLSGDLCLSFDVGNKVVIAIADISGKGITAGMWFATLACLLHVHATEPSPQEAMNAINDSLATIKPDPPLVTLFLAYLDWHSHRIEYCNAGHPSPIVLRKNGAAAFLGDGGPVLGAILGAQFRGSEIRFGVGDAMLAFTDGVSELRNPADEEYGIDGVLNAAGKIEHVSATRTLFSLLGMVQDFSAGVSVCDDLSLLVLLRKITSER